MSSAEFSEAITAAIKAENPQTQIVLSGMLVIEVLEAGDDSPSLRTIAINDPSAWALVGMLYAAQMIAEGTLSDCFVDDEDDD